VHSEVFRCKYPDAWMETLQRYAELAVEGGASLYAQFYLDLCVTVLTKRIIAVDIHHIVGGGGGGGSGSDDAAAGQSKESTDMRVIHAIMFKMSLSRMLHCVSECLLGCSPPDDDTTTAVAMTVKLYDRLESMLNERYYRNDDDGKYYARHETFDLSATVHGLVHGWLVDEALPEICTRIAKERNTDIMTVAAAAPLTGLKNTRVLSSSHPSFFAVSHCYWLWLHLTAAGLQTARAETDFLTLFYAFDLFIYCPQCSTHFTQHRTAFYTRQPYTVSVRTAHTARSIVYNMHNVVNRETGKEVLPPTVMTDYTAYWERCRLMAAGN
jgi:hypothetical protein